MGLDEAAFECLKKENEQLKHENEDLKKRLGVECGIKHTYRQQTEALKKELKIMDKVHDDLISEAATRERAQDRLDMYICAAMQGLISSGCRFIITNTDQFNNGKAEINTAQVVDGSIVMANACMKAADEVAG